MRATGTFEVTELSPADVVPPVEIETGLPVGVVTMVKTFQGEVTGRSVTIFTSAFDPERGGTYVALESFEGSLLDRSGSFNFVHVATSTGTDRTGEHFEIVPGSGTGGLTGITGTGGMSVSGAGGHEIVFDYSL